MKCSHCGGLVTWRGPLSNLSHTECANCGRQNCQEVESQPFDNDQAPNPNDDPRAGCVNIVVTASAAGAADFTVAPAGGDDGT